MGNVLLALKCYEEAMQACDHALGINQNDVRALLNKGIALFALKRYEEAIQAYDIALDIDKDEARVLVTWATKGIALRDLNRYEETIQAYDRALAIVANYESALQGRKATADALKAAR
jgi:tetratricopeptide (TPR) repeat protein